VWILTGDKIETAWNIGMSAGLLDHTMGQYIIESCTKDEIGKDLLDKFNIIEKVRSDEPDKKQAILVAGASLLVITEDEALKEDFLKCATLCEVVLACRMSPA